MDEQIKILFGKNTPNGADLESLHKIMLVNAHSSVDYPESLPPNIINVGGLQTKESKPLDKKINDFLEAGQKGSVIMSLGTNFRSDMLET